MGIRQVQQWRSQPPFPTITRQYSAGSTLDPPSLPSFDEQLSQLIRQQRELEARRKEQTIIDSRREAFETAFQQQWTENDDTGFLDDVYEDLPRHPSSSTSSLVAPSPNNRWRRAKDVFHRWGRQSTDSDSLTHVTSVSSPLPLEDLSDRATDSTNDSRINTIASGEQSLIKNVVTMRDYKTVVADERNKITVVRFYAPWCRACKAMEVSFRQMSRQYGANDNVQFVQVPVLPENAALHQGLGIPRVPYGHILHPDVGIVEELSLNRKHIAKFQEILQSYVDGHCSLVEHDSTEDNAEYPNESVTLFPSPYVRKQ
jgi:thiol-disulfide isomerase/thioredoxin